MKIDLQFGALAPQIYDQLQSQGITAASLRADSVGFQRDADAVVRLHVRGLLPEAQVQLARRRLMKSVVGVYKQVDGNE